MATIEKRTADDGSTTYRVKVRLRGFPEDSASFARLTDAKKWGSATESAMREGRYFKTPEARKRTFADLADRYIRDVVPGKSEAQRTRQTQQLLWWKEQLGHLVLADLTPDAINEARNKLAADPPPGRERRSAGSVNRYIAALSHALNMAVDPWKWLDHSPLSKKSRLKEPKGRVRCLSDDERAALLKACRESRQPLLFPLVVTALGTGARQGELLGLKWRDVDLKAKVARALKTKNKEARALPLAGPALEALTELSKVRSISDARVFPLTESQVRIAFEAAVKAAKLADFRFHDLRHSAASYLAMSGATLAEIAEVLGHKTLSMVKRYSHLTEAHTAAVVERMSAKFLEG